MKYTSKFLILAAILSPFAFAADLDLSWNDNSSNESGFIVERSSDGANFEQIGTVSENVTAYTDVDVPVGLTLSYRVKAWNAFGDSGYTNTVSVETSPPGNPDGLKLGITGRLSRWFKNLGKGKGRKS